MAKFFEVPKPPCAEPVQDGMLAFYLACASASDVNVERRIESEPFVFGDYLNPSRLKAKFPKLTSK
jgi:hypothetical protein